MAKKLTREMIDAMREEFLAYGPKINAAIRTSEEDANRLQNEQMASDYGRLFTKYIEEYLKPGGDELDVYAWALREFG